MFKIDDDMTINVTRGDCGTIDVSATVDGAVYVFLPGDILRLKVFEKKNCENVVLKKDFGIDVNATTVTLTLTGKDTKIGGMINKPTNYWYEIELNPETNPQTIVGYDDEGPKLFCLHPEGNEVEETEPEEADVGAFDDKLDLTSNKALPNWLIAQEILALKGKMKETGSNTVYVSQFGEIGKGDDRETIEKAVAALTDNSTLFFPKGHYVVKQSVNKESIILLENKKNITIDLNGSTIELQQKLRTSTVGFDTYNIIELVDCENFVIKNGTLKGDRVSHKYEGSSTHEFGYGILARAEQYNSKDPNLYPDDRTPTDKKCGGLIYNMVIYDLIGDGVVIKNGMSPEKVTIRDCEIHHCRRQGITISDSDFTIVDSCHIHHIGVECDDVKGTSPMAGIDVECGSGTYCAEKVVIKDTIIENTGGGGVVSKSKTSDDNITTIVKEISITNCKTDSVHLNTYKEFGTIDEAKRTKPIVDNCVITHQDRKHLGRNMGTVVVGSAITNCLFCSGGHETDSSIDNMFSAIDNANKDSFTKLERCVINALATQRITNINPINCVINGGIIKISNAAMNTNNWTFIGDCINTVFNGSLVDLTGDNGLNKYRGCSFFDCSGKGTPSESSFNCIDCYFETKLFDSSNYHDCVFEDEITV